MDQGQSTEEYGSWFRANILSDLRIKRLYTSTRGSLNSQSTAASYSGTLSTSILCSSKKTMCADIRFEGKPRWLLGRTTVPVESNGDDTDVRARRPDLHGKPHIDVHTSVQRGNIMIDVVYSRMTRAQCVHFVHMGTLYPPGCFLHSPNGSRQRNLPGEYPLRPQRNCSG